MALVYRARERRQRETESNYDDQYYSRPTSRATFPGIDSILAAQNYQNLRESYEKIRNLPLHSLDGSSGKFDFTTAESVGEEVMANSLRSRINVRQVDGRAWQIGGAGGLSRQLSHSRAPFRADVVTGPDHASETTHPMPKPVDTLNPDIPAKSPARLALMRNASSTSRTKKANDLLLRGLPIQNTGASPILKELDTFSQRSQSPEVPRFNALSGPAHNDKHTAEVNLNSISCRRKKTDPKTQQKPDSSATETNASIGPLAQQTVSTVNTIVEAIEEKVTTAASALEATLEPVGRELKEVTNNAADLVTGFVEGLVPANALLPLTAPEVDALAGKTRSKADGSDQSWNSCKSNDSRKHQAHPLLKPHAEPRLSEVLAPPVLTSGMYTEDSWKQMDVEDAKLRAKASYESHYSTDEAVKSVKAAELSVSGIQEVFAYGTPIDDENTKLGHSSTAEASTVEHGLMKEEISPFADSAHLAATSMSSSQLGGLERSSPKTETKIVLETIEKNTGSPTNKGLDLISASGQDLERESDWEDRRRYAERLSGRNSAEPVPTASLELAEIPTSTRTTSILRVEVPTKPEEAPESKDEEAKISPLDLYAELPDNFPSNSRSRKHRSQTQTGALTQTDTGKLEDGLPWFKRLLQRVPTDKMPARSNSLTAFSRRKPRSKTESAVMRRSSEAPGTKLSSQQKPPARASVISSRDKLVLENHTEALESFERAVSDLEGILSEALSVAKLASGVCDERPDTRLHNVKQIKNVGQPDKLANIDPKTKDSDSEASSLLSTCSSSSFEPFEVGEASKEHLVFSKAQTSETKISEKPHVKISDFDKRERRHTNKAIENRRATPYPSATAANSRKPSHVLVTDEADSLEHGSSESGITPPLFGGRRLSQEPSERAFEASSGSHRAEQSRKHVSGNLSAAPTGRFLLSTLALSSPSSDEKQHAVSTGQERRDAVLQSNTTRRRSITPPKPASITSVRASSMALPSRAYEQPKIRTTTAGADSEAIWEHIRKHKAPPINARRSSVQLQAVNTIGKESTRASVPPPSGRPPKGPLPEPPNEGENPRRRPSASRRASTEALTGLGLATLGDEPEKDGGKDKPIELQNRNKHKHRSGEEGVATGSRREGFSLRNRRHHSIRDHRGFNLSRSHRRQPIARDWGVFRKRFVATVACITTALMGLITGIYAGEVPSIQYQIVDFHHYTILGNIFLYITYAITTFLFWPLPLLHGRKPYVLGALALLMPLQMPQAIAVTSNRSPYVATYRVALLLGRAASGIVMGFININLKATLLDLFGASLQSKSPHQEFVMDDDLRRHGGGLGLWLSIWTWCFVGSLGVGFLIGAAIIEDLNPSWGFWIVVIIAAFVLLLNVLSPEVRRSPHRRSVAQVVRDQDVSSRVARGEVMLHLKQTGPIWWWEEVWAGVVLSGRMLKQSGFSVMALYVGWIYGQMVIVIVLLGALISKYYRFRSTYVGLCVLALPIGALVALPFEKASFFSRSRKDDAQTDMMTFDKRVTWSSHLVRRTVFTVLLPVAGLAYTISSTGPPRHFMLPTVFAGAIGFLSNMAITECHGIMMETFDVSDLQTGIPGSARRPSQSEGSEALQRRRPTNYSSFPRVSAGFAITQAVGFALAAAATGVGGVIERRLGAQAATGIIAGILLVLTIALFGVLWRGFEVEVADQGLQPEHIHEVPSTYVRRMNLLERGGMSRWTEIRRLNGL